MGGELIQVDPGPCRFVVSIRVSKVSQVGDAAARQLSRAVPVSPGTTDQQAIAELAADYPGKEASTFQKVP